MNQPNPPVRSAEPTRRSPTRRPMVILTALVVIGVGVAAAVYFSRGKSSNANPGDCIKVNSATEESADVVKIDCNNLEAVFKVAKKLGNGSDKCPTEQYVKYSERGGNVALCLMQNVKEGDCFANFETTSRIVRVDCGNADVKIAKVVTGKVDEAACDQAGIPYSYPEPPTTFCLGQP